MSVEVDELRAQRQAIIDILDGDGYPYTPNPLRAKIRAVVAAPMSRSDTGDCRSEAGVTVGLIDALISVCRILVRRDLAPAHEALADLAADEDVAAVLDATYRMGTA